MLLDTQNQFREEHINALKKGEEISLAPGYAELYEKWSQANKEIIYKLSAEEITQSFSDFVASEVKNKTWALIDQMQIDEDKKNQLRQLATRGQTLLVSRSGGQYFDQVLTTESLKKAVATDYQVLSSTFRATTTNLREIIDEQALLYVGKKLREQYFTLQSAWIDKDHQVHVEIVPRGGIQEVKVDLSQDTSKPLVYEFIDQEGKVKKVLETQLPEEFGEPQEERSLRLPTEEELRVSQAADTDSAANAALAASQAANLANIVNQLNAKNAAAAQKEREVEELAGLAEQASILEQVTGPLSNVMAGKAAVKAKTTRQEKQAEGEKERMENAKTRRGKDAQEQKEKRKEEKEFAIQQKQKRRKGMMKGGAAVAAGASGLIAGGTGLTLFINNIINVL